MHVRAVHQKEKLYQCNECNYSSSQDASLKIHIAAVHKKDKRFKCNACSASAGVRKDRISFGVAIDV